MSVINFLEDPNLSLKAKGIMAYLCSLPEKEATTEDLISAGPDGRDSIASGIKELVSHGYVSEHKSEAGYVYLINAQPGIYKIGKTKSPKTRLKRLGVQLPFEIEVTHLVKSNDYGKAEKILHDKYKEKRIRGEWFNLSDTDVQDFKKINKLNFGMEVD